MRTMISLPDETFNHPALDAAVAKARAALPFANGRVDRAVSIVLNGDVKAQPDGTCLVASQSKPGTLYGRGGACDCEDARFNTQGGWCAHRIACVLFKQMQPTEREPGDDDASDDECFVSTDADGIPCCAVNDGCPGHQAPPTTAALPEAPASVNCYIALAGRQVQLTMRGHNATTLLAELETVLQRFPVEAPPATVPAATPVTAAPAATPDQAPPAWCSLHALWMKRTAKNGNSWWSHRLPDGGWCKGK